MSYPPIHKPDELWSSAAEEAGVREPLIQERGGLACSYCPYRGLAGRSSASSSNVPLPVGEPGFELGNPVGRESVSSVLGAAFGHLLADGESVDCRVAGWRAGAVCGDVAVQVVQADVERCSCPEGPLPVGELGFNLADVLGGHLSGSVVGAAAGDPGADGESVDDVAPTGVAGAVDGDVAAQMGQPGGEGRPGVGLSLPVGELGLELRDPLRGQDAKAVVGAACVDPPAYRESVDNVLLAWVAGAVHGPIPM